MHLKAKEVEALQAELAAMASKIKELGGSSVLILVGVDTISGKCESVGYVRSMWGNPYACMGIAEQWKSDMVTGLYDSIPDEESDEDGDDEGQDLFDADGNLK